MHNDEYYTPGQLLSVTRLKEVFLAGNEPRQVFGPDRPIMARRVYSAMVTLEPDDDTRAQALWGRDPVAERYIAAHRLAQTHLEHNYYEYGLARI